MKVFSNKALFPTRHFLSSKVPICYADFRRALRFEADQEKIYHDLYKISGLSRYVPRGYSIYKLLVNYRILLQIAIPILILIWALFLQFLYSSFLFFRWMIPTIVAKKTLIPERIYLSLSDIKYFTLIEKADKEYPIAIVNFPFKKSPDTFRSDLDYVSFLQLTSVLDLFRAYLKSVGFCWYLLFTTDRNLALYSYTSFHWFWVQGGFRKCNINRIWISNHFDRWTVLVASLKTNVTLVQHGQLEYIDSRTGHSLFPIFREKLRNITDVYAHNKQSEEYFNRFILNEINFHRVTSKLHLVNWRPEGENKVKILVIGHQHGLTFQKKFIRTLVNNSENLDFCYKYHPQQLKLISETGIWQIKESNVVPKADIVISYGSSLDDEIRNLIDCRIHRYDSSDIFNTNREVYQEFIATIDASIIGCGS